MAIMPNNWSAVFKDAAGNDVYTAGGYESEVTMDIKTPDTFLNLALVELSKRDQFGNLPIGLSLKNGWNKVAVEAPVFGIAGHEVYREDVDNQKIQSAEQDAWNNNFKPCASF